MISNPAIIKQRVLETCRSIQSDPSVNLNLEQVHQLVLIVAEFGGDLVDGRRRKDSPAVRRLIRSLVRLGWLARSGEATHGAQVRSVSGLSGNGGWATSVSIGGGTVTAHQYRATPEALSLVMRHTPSNRTPEAKELRDSKAALSGDVLFELDGALDDPDRHVYRKNDLIDRLPAFDQGRFPIPPPDSHVLAAIQRTSDLQNRDADLVDELTTTVEVVDDLVVCAELVLCVVSCLTVALLG